MVKLLAIPALVAMVIAAAGSDGLPGWAQVGIALGVAVSVATKQLVPGWVYADMCVRLINSESENKRLTQTLLDTQPKTIAALEASNRLVEDQAAELRVLRRVQ